jgi:putative Holliday junction resolvase
MKFLAIDYGQKRIGLATSDEGETFALPFDTLLHSGSTPKAAKALLEIIGREAIDEIVVGLPRDNSGGESEMETATREFAAHLASALQKSDREIPFHWWDERFSTASVLKGLRGAGVTQKNAKSKTGKESIDARAAAVILQDFLDARKLRATFENSGQAENEDAF